MSDSKTRIPTTLAQRVQQIREQQGLSQTKLAELANLPLAQVQDIEAGIELFLSANVRQKLARVLKMRPASLKALEKPIPLPPPALSHSARENYIEEMLLYPHAVHPCPSCKSPLEVRIFNRRDLEDNPLVEVKAHCTKCLFRL